MPIHVHFHPEPDVIADEIDATRTLFGINEESLAIPDKVNEFYFPKAWAERVAKDLEEFVPEGKEPDKDVAAQLAWYLEQTFADRFFAALRDSAKLGLAAIGSSPEALKFHIEKMHFELQDYRNALELAILVSTQADRLRRKFGLSNDWPADKAILFGSGYAPPPFIGELRPRLRKKALGTQFGLLLFEAIPLPLDDNRQVQHFRDQWNWVFEEFQKQHRDRRRRGLLYGPLSLRNDDGASEEIPMETEEQFLYSYLQDSLPSYLRQPLPQTATPKRVIDQRLRDAKRRRQRSMPRGQSLLLPAKQRGGRKTKTKI